MRTPPHSPALRRSPRKPSLRHRYTSGWIRASPAQSRKTKKTRISTSPPLRSSRVKPPSRSVKPVSLPCEIFFKIAHFVSANENTPTDSQKALAVASQVCRDWRGPFQHDLFRLHPTCLSTDTFITGRGFTQLLSSGHFASLVTILRIQMHHLTWLDALDYRNPFSNLRSITLEGTNSLRLFTCPSPLFRKCISLIVVKFVDLVITTAELTQFFYSLEANTKTSGVRKLAFDRCEFDREVFLEPAQALPISFANLLLVLKETRNSEIFLTDYHLYGLSRLSMTGPRVSLPTMLQFLHVHGSRLTHLSLLGFYDSMLELAMEEFARRFVQRLASVDLNLLEHLSVQYTLRTTKISDIVLEKLLTESFPNLISLFVNTQTWKDGRLDNLLSEIASRKPKLIVHVNSRFTNWYITEPGLRMLDGFIQRFPSRLRLGQGGEDCSDDELMAKGIPWC
ncbi:hypothetical protein K435DRAFT_793162 [Dendrothele bispora CBS 962.96]|uniref:F-box domain-containing protein n=1 Tax=Dendrothele bispora (strain CBS 962.96) TaxID=1314807 RepID=A0A4S8MG99_DENBC|nr:hypothetical protein K435DRAFT_793162 [Dendrothele bispora CBS 962.96]